jgi:hypothetical protein
LNPGSSSLHYRRINALELSTPIFRSGVKLVELGLCEQGTTQILNAVGLLHVEGQGKQKTK